MFSKVTRSIAVFLAVVILLCCMSGCVSDNVIKQIFNSEIISPLCSSADLHRVNRDTLKETASSGFVTLYYDSTSASVAVLDKSSGLIWSALPAYTSELSAMINAVLITEGGRYYLNSQDNSVAFSSFETDFTDSGVKITYNMSDNEVTASKSSDELFENDIFVSVPVEISLTDGSLSVNIDCENIFVPDGCILESISVMPYFGAISYTDNAINSEKALNSVFSSALQTEATTEVTPSVAEAETADSTENDIYEEKGDFLLVPDGCGAVVYTEREDTATEKLSFDIYGNSDLEDTYTACVPAFGIKKNGAAFVAVIGDGAEYGTVKANRASAASDAVNRVYSEFSVSSTAVDGEKIYSSKLYDGDISLCYRFMSGSEADYINMASSCREYLIRLGVLSSKTVSCQTLPVNIEIIGSVDGSYKTLVSELSETEDMLSVVKAKGINNINVILQGFFENGILQSSGDSISPMHKTGGNSAFEELCSYCEKQKFNLFTGINIMTSSDGASSAKTLTGDKIQAVVQNPLSPYIGKESYSVNLLRVDKISQNVIDIMNSSKDISIAGFCINDAAKYLYADYSSGQNGNITETMNITAENVSAFAIHSELMLKGCNFCSVKEASYLLDIPFYTQYPESNAYCAVPFVPAILHSTVNYSGTAANTAELPTLEMLKCVEYGGVPSFCWVMSMKSHLYYGLNLAETVEFVTRASQELADIAGARITGHEKVEDGVYMTSYDSGSVIYVNYNNYSVNVGNISISPYDYIRLN